MRVVDPKVFAAYLRRYSMCVCKRIDTFPRNAPDSGSNDIRYARGGSGRGCEAVGSSEQCVC